MKLQSNKFGFIVPLIPVITGVISLAVEIIGLFKKDEPEELQAAKKAKHEAVLYYCQHECKVYKDMKGFYKHRFMNCRAIRCEHFWETRGGTK